jgi:zinc D-Ala-D-Ala dipeptidase
MRPSTLARMIVASSLATTVGCARSSGVLPRASEPAAQRPTTLLEGSRQMVLVLTPSWNSTTGTLRRFSRGSDAEAWRPEGEAVPVVVGRTGVAWDDAQVSARPGEPTKREGDGRSPAGAFALDTAFGFDIRQIVPWVRLPYVQLRTTTECVDDPRSAHYNTIVDRTSVPSVDWASSERMREIEQYAFGVHVAYNAPPRPARGSCIFLHIWSGPGSVTAGCTAMTEQALRELMGWIDPTHRPMLVQLPAVALERVRESWGLPP